MKKWVTFLATLVMMCALTSTSYAKDSVKEPTGNAGPGRRCSCTQNGCG